MTPLVKLKPYITQVRGVAYKPDEIADTPFEDSVPLLKANNITVDGLDSSSLIYIAADKIKSEQFIRAGDLLLAASSGSKKAVGKNAHFPESFSGSFGAFCKVVRPKNGLCSEYLKHFFKTRYYRSSIENAVQGANINNLRNEHLDDLDIPLPPLSDQIRIAHLLDKVEGLLVQRKQHLQQLDGLLKSVFLEMFGPKNPDYEAWPLVEIRELAAKHKGAMRTGPFGSNLLRGEFMSDGDVAVLGIDNAVQNRFAWGERRFISNEKYQELQSYRVFPGDVIVTLMGTIGRSAVIPDDIPVAINTKHLAAITLNGEIANPLFLSYAIHSSPYVLRQFASKNRGAIMSGLNLGIVKEVKIKRAPIGLQGRFAEIHKGVDQLRSRYQKSLACLESLYGALSQQAFKGELDISRVPTPKSQTQHVGAISIEDQVSVPEPVVQTVPVINLPTSDKLPAALENAEARKALIGEWLHAYREQLHGMPLSAQDFMAAAQARLVELLPETDLELRVSDYEHIKAWVFDALEAGTLTQEFDNSGNRIKLKAVLV